MKKLLTAKKARTIINRFKKAKVLVIGDLIMDNFIWGSVKRISPEAPVPVVEVKSETLLLGGSANVAANIDSLGGSSSAVGVVGSDDNGRVLKKMLSKKGIAVGGVIVDSKRPTTVKTRVIAHSQQVVRFDREDKETPRPVVMEKISAFITKSIHSYDVIVISDYAKGLITEELVWLITELATGSRRSGKPKPVLVDPKVENFDSYGGTTFVTPNNLEASQASGIEIKDSETLQMAGKLLMGSLGSEALLITRGEHGMSLFEEGSETHIPTVAREVYDVSGAGDTVMGVLALSLASGASYKEAAVLANLAAGIVVGKVGTATVEPKELLLAVQERLKEA
ncbi:MAG: D-glycero-beta-D-manno-heptose-7-phosphate kinase [Deltaproteobacteria bacterium]|nr:D-glycero-beta-D-manno-heptose-7-phosphate kinase [Deltaproteobacteria bacterium]